jgi:hypothetical protein
MARGWESKSVEETRDLLSEALPKPPKETSAEALALERQKNSLELSRERIIREWNESVHPRRRAQLAEALAFLEKQLQALNS